MKVLHTSDWHLGNTLLGQKRYDEAAAFLDWLRGFIAEQQIDVMIIAGDVFDTPMPSNKAQALYYRFVADVGELGCQTVVVAGNHDSPTFLDAAAQALKALNVHVVGMVGEKVEDEVLLLRDGSDSPMAVVMAVPYLRDADVRRVQPGESIDDKAKALIDGQRAHYATVCAAAKDAAAAVAHGADLPLIATGHLFVAGGKTHEGDGVRELYVGNLAHAGADIFPDDIDYLALGHLHMPQRVAGQDHLRYCGAPLPMGFDEALRRQQILVVEFVGRQPLVTAVDVPMFQAMETVSGDVFQIGERLEALAQNGESCWVAVEYTGEGLVPDLRQQVLSMVDGSAVEVLRIGNRRAVAALVAPESVPIEALEALTVHDVFERLLEIEALDDETCEGLRHSYKELVESVMSRDGNAE